ncbi:hypothetical protein NKH77_04010 [Streptomyces sp. M19]
MLAVIAVLVAIDWLTGNEIRLIGVAGLLALSVAELCTLPQTVLILCCDLAASVLVYGWLVPADTLETLVSAFSGPVLLGVACVLLCRLRLQREALLARTVTVSDAVQRTILRELPIRAGPVAVSGFSMSSEGTRWSAATSTRPCPPRSGPAS